MFSLLVTLMQQPITPPIPAPEPPWALINGVWGGIATIVVAWMTWKNRKKAN